MLHSDRYWYFWEVEKPTEGETYMRSQHNNIQCLQSWYRPVRMHNIVHILWQHGDRFSQPGVCLRQKQAPRATKVHAIQSQASYMNPYIIGKSYLVSTVSIFYCISSFICLSLLYAWLTFRFLSTAVHDFLCIKNTQICHQNEARGLFSPILLSIQSSPGLVFSYSSRRYVPLCHV